MSGNAPNLRSGQDGLLGEVWSLYYRQGYDEGYQRAVRDLGIALLALCEEYVAQTPQQASELRRVLYPFEQYLERRLVSMSPDKDFYVEGGMGI